MGLDKPRPVDHCTAALQKHIKPNDHVISVLRAINEAGHDQIILSNTRPHDLLWFVETVGIGEYFPKDKIFGVNAHQKHGTKEDVLEEYIHGRKDLGIIIIGDSESDMNLSRVGGGVTYLYTHPNVDALTNVSADNFINDLRKILVEL